MFGLRQKKYGFLIKKRVLLENTLLNWIWLIIGVYKAPIQKDEIFLRNLNLVQINTVQNIKILLIRDFNLTTSNVHLAGFMTLFNLESLIKTPLLIFNPPVLPA